MTKKSLSIPQWVGVARGTRGIKEFAAASGLSTGQISQLENGKVQNPSWETLCVIARASQGRCGKPCLPVRE